jgi:hypothetical protein
MGGVCSTYRTMINVGLYILDENLKKRNRLNVLGVNWRITLKKLDVRV